MGQSREIFVLNQFLTYRQGLGCGAKQPFHSLQGFGGSVAFPGALTPCCLYWAVALTEFLCRRNLCNGAARAEGKIQEPVHLATWPEVINKRLCQLFYHLLQQDGFALWTPAGSSFQPLLLPLLQALLLLNQLILQSGPHCVIKRRFFASEGNRKSSRCGLHHC